MTTRFSITFVLLFALAYGSGTTDVYGYHVIADVGGGATTIAAGE